MGGLLCSKCEVFSRGLLRVKECVLLDTSGVSERGKEGKEGKEGLKKDGKMLASSESRAGDASSPIWIVSAKMLDQACQR